jgi:rhodanese-related sulfurtransferase
VLGTGVCQILDWQAGATGLNERTAAAAGLKFKAVVVPGSDRLGYMPGVKNIVLKLLAEEGTERVLGVQAVGRGGVDKRIDTLVAAISLGATLEDLSNFDIAYAPPFNGPIDNIATAANVLHNKLEGQMNGINPKDFEAMKKEPGYLFVDVRTPGEFAANRIAGIENKVNMPLGVLREQGKNLPVKPGEKIITSCQIDLRGYEAECILRGLGYENVHSLEGGMSGWPYATESDKKK